MKLDVILAPENIEPAPSRSLMGYKQISGWVEESIWGHRLWSRQQPWLLFLEFLNVADGFADQNSLFEPTPGGTIPGYALFRRLELRNLLFNNSFLPQIDSERTPDDAKWTRWLDEMKKGSRHVSAPDYSYLRDRFPTFGSFATLVKLLRDTAIAPPSGRRIESYFLFPFGRSALYQDLDQKGNVDRSNFGRTGELLYMMLARAGRTEELRAEFSKLLSTNSSSDRVVQKLQPENVERAGKNEAGGYLPYRKHPAYERLAEDWLAAFALNLPGYDAYAHLVPLGTLHVLIYQLETASAWLGKEAPCFICEVPGQRPGGVREHSTRSFINNDKLTLNAIRVAFDQIVNSEEWTATMSALSDAPYEEQLEKMAELLDEKLWIQVQGETLEGMLAAAREYLEKKADNTAAHIHYEFGRHCGLINRRASRVNRYAPTDSLLKTLVLVNVREPMEFSEFLAKLYERYRIVFGHIEANQAGVVGYEEAPFKKNRDRLEERLKSMGILKRLSDTVAYVENPAVTNL